MRYDLNKVVLTEEDQATILHFLRQARKCGYPSGNEPYYPIIDRIMNNYYDTDETEGQRVDTRS